MSSPERPGPDAARGTPPLPKERWKGPPGGIPDEEGPRGKGCLNPLIMAGSLALIAWGLFAAIYFAVFVRWHMGGYFGFFLEGLTASVVGAVVMLSARHRLRAPTLGRPEAGTAAASGCLPSFMLVAGCALLLPGACSLLFGLSAMGSVEHIGDPSLLLAVFTLGAVGIASLWWVSARPAGVAGPLMAAGIVFMIPGLFLAVYGFSRLYWINQMPSVLLPIGLPAGVIGIVCFWMAWQRWLADASADPLAVPPGPAPDS
ncbi:hypothetical protein; putative membrane protein [Bradyrhizobium sp. ORS 278]|uniref:hypothetical protein n=1 Tax=Bradyrhizobium sp. (strain ORS 278) TaxID=114615 RepID=UPI0001507C44|nr:hypothetical protein [Bradyrhizobium sp. ORS 278]CAL74224.1 hypothetical protein; putative membrane protein [Bradyrhizobium sp. ORS 278]